MPNMFVEQTLRLRLNIGQFTGQKLDRKTTAKVAKDAGAKGEAGRYYKQLVSCPELADYTRNSDRARIFITENTLPWDDGGVRIITGSMFFDITDKLSVFEEKSRELADKFCEYYADKRDREEERLGSLFDPLDYPDVDTIRGKFYFKSHFEPMSDSGDFRIELGDEWEKKLKDEHDERINNIQNLATRELWSRLHDAVDHLRDRLSGEKNIFRDSVVENLTTITELLPKLNVMGDVDLDNMMDDVRTKLTLVTPKILRADTKERARICKEAERIVKEINTQVTKLEKAA